MSPPAGGAAWMDGRVVPLAEARLHVTDWGLIHADIVYDVVPVWQGGFFRLPDYLARFRRSMMAAVLDPGLDDGAIRAALHDMVGASGLQDAYCAMVCSRGVPTVPGSRDPRDCANHFYAWCVPYVHVITPEIAARGAHLHIPEDVRRIPEASVNPRAKNYHWGDFTRALLAAKERGFDNTLLMDAEGNMTEGPGTNLFAVRQGCVITPDRGVLEGITRRTVLEICADLGIATEVRALPHAELMEADEVFLSSSGGGPIPVSRIDGRIFSNDAPGPISRQLRETYWQWIQRPDFREDISYA
ncbi:MAG: aminotransferase class IV [Pseudomonadota bacterium]